MTGPDSPQEMIRSKGERQSIPEPQTQPSPRSAPLEVASDPEETPATASATQPGRPHSSGDSPASQDPPCQYQEEHILNQEVSFGGNEGDSSGDRGWWPGWYQVGLRG